MSKYPPKTLLGTFVQAIHRYWMYPTRRFLNSTHAAIHRRYMAERLHESTVAQRHRESMFAWYFGSRTGRLL